MKRYQWFNFLIILFLGVLLVDHQTILSECMIGSPSSQTIETSIQQIIESSPGNSPGTGMTNIVLNTQSDINLEVGAQILKEVTSAENILEHVDDNFAITFFANSEDTWGDVQDHQKKFLSKEEDDSEEKKE